MPDWFTGAEQEGSDYSGTLSVEFVDGDYGLQAVVTTILDDPITKKDGTLRLDLPSFYRLPDTWKVLDGRLVHESGDMDKVLPKSNQWQQFVAAAGECDKRAAEYLTRDGLNPYMEQAWTDSRFHLHQLPGRKYEAFTTKEGVEKPAGETRGIIVPDEWLGTKDAPLSGDVGAPVVASVDAAGVLAEIGLSESAFEALSALAGKASGTEFVTDAMEFKGEASNVQAFVKALSNGTLHGALLAE